MLFWLFPEDLSNLAHPAWEEELVYLSLGITIFSSYESENQLISHDVFKWFK